MHTKKVFCCGLVLVLGAMLAAVPAAAADSSGLASATPLGRKNITRTILRALWHCTPAMPAACRPIRKRCMVAMPFWPNSRPASIGAWPKSRSPSHPPTAPAMWATGAGTYVITGADGSHIDHGKWMLVSKKTSGVWKTQCDIFNSDMPMPAMSMK